ncbi:MAG: thiamine pyrophosphate-binding protein [Gulosibacter sp.]|uniref:thiamine pyrophosphate-binding protein n=1 Tax=Gulosibacter sp. TaxID=2817531 RepID=UPI003F912888
MTESIDLPEGVVTDNTGLAVLTTLKNYGIDTIFGIPGTHNLEFYRHLEPLGIRAVTTRHEQGAGYGADGWSHQTGKPGVVITTSGPGLLNALSSAATAFCESRPMIVLAPGVPLGAEFADIGALHETKDTVGAAAAVVEWARRVSTAEEAVQAVHDAFELFATGRPRPVYIEVPLDVLEGAADVADTAFAARELPAPARAESAAIQDAAKQLADAKSPVILAGGGSIPAGDGLRELAELLDAPVITTMNGKGAIPESHPLALGSALRFKAAHEVVNDADVVLAIGSKIAEVEMWWGQLEPRGTLIRVDLLESQIDKNLTADLGVVGSSATVVPDLVNVLKDAEFSNRAQIGAERVRSALAAFEREGTEFAPDLTAVAKAVAAGVPEDVIISGDSSQICYFGTSTNIPVESAKSFLYMATYATLGYGLPAAIGAKIASPDRPVVSVLGDGALMFSVQEFATAVEQGVDIVVVVVDNGGYAEIEQNEADRGIPPVGVRLTQPDWPALTTAFGGTGRALERPEDLPSLVQQAISEGGVQLIHVPLSLFQN